MTQIQVGRKIVLHNLAALTNKEFQEKGWAAKIPHIIASLTETYHMLYLDSLLQEALEKNDGVFSKTTDSKLRILREKLSPITEEKGYNAEAAYDPRMQEIRQLAADILSEILLSEDSKTFKEYLDSVF